MVKRIIKRILVFSSVACLVLACLPSVSFAIDPVSGAAALAGAIDAYGMAYGVGTVYDVSSSSGVSSSFEGLWDDFSEYQNNSGSQFDYDSYIENYNQNRSLYGFEHSSGKFAAWSIDAESAEIFDQFWNWLLTGPAEMTRVDNEYFQFSQSQIGPDASPITVSTFSSWSNQPIPYISGSSTTSVYVRENGYLLYQADPNLVTPGYDTCCVLGRNGSTPIYVFCYPDGASTKFVACSNVSGLTYCRSNVANNQLSNKSIGQFDSSSGLYYDNSMSESTSTSSYNNPTPFYASLSAGLSAISGFLSTGFPSEDIGVKAYGNGYVNVPDPTLPDYEPTPLEIVTNIPWDSTYDDTDEEVGEPVPFPPVDVPLVVDDIITAISAEDYALEEDPQDPDPDAPPPAPSEVFVPLLPVGLPSFNFSFSGIWHYVREWVASLGAWFTTLFTIWGALPYAMVVPVYATAVVVIVLGVYKRFFM